MTSRHLLPLFGLLLALAAAAPLPAQAAPAEVGDLWEDTMEMNIPGMPARPQVHQRCSARNADAVPTGSQDNGNCTTSDVKRTPTSMAWKMSCPGTTGSGEMVYEGRDRYRGTMTMTSEGRTMTMKMSGRRLGECDAAEARRKLDGTRQQVAAAQQQADDAMAAACKGAVDGMQPRMLGADSPYRCAPAHKAEFCRRLQTPEGYSTVSLRGTSSQPGLHGGDLAESAAFCGIDAVQTRTRLCTAAEQQESLDMLANSCIAHGYGKPIIARECAGRDFTSPPAPRYTAFCSAVARAGMMQPEPGGRVRRTAAAPATATPQDAAVEAGKQLIKGLFGR
jgi:hypothetical protein